MEDSEAETSAMDDKFSFGSPQLRSDTPGVGSPSQEASLMTSQEASLVTMHHTAVPSIAAADTPPSLGSISEQTDENTSTGRAGQEASLLQVMDTGQEPSLAPSSDFADGGSQLDSNSLAASSSASLQQAAPAAASSSMQPLSNSGATDAAGSNDTAIQHQAEQQHLEEPSHQPEAAGNTAATAAAPEGATRQADKAYFVDGMRAIDVEVDCGPGTPCKLLHVLIDVSAMQQDRKVFMGGYKHKHNGSVYHHACSQTPKPPTQETIKDVAAADDGHPCAAGKQKLSRETQTIKAASTSSQTVREAATQVARPGLELDCSGDRLLTPRPYTTSEVVEQRRQAAAVTIQRYSRGWMARQRAGALRGIKAERDGFLAAAAAERESVAQQQRRREVERRTHPLSQSDFELLSSELEAWRQQQTAAIKAAAQQQDQQERGFDQQGALQLLLAKETRLLQTLDKLRVNAKQEVKALSTHKMLNHLAQPKTWTLSNGKKVMVHTPTTVRATELQQLYRGLTLPALTLDERLDVLLHVKWAVREFDCALARELLELIDREADLLNRGRSPKTLDGLRCRIAGAFLAFCKTPAFNPEAAKLQLLPGGPTEPETFEYVDECAD